MKIKTAIIVDHLSLMKWQKNALENAKKKLDVILILNCENTKTKRQILKHFLYYVLNLFSLKNFLSKKSLIEYSKIKIINFNSIYSGSWQSLPGNVINELKKKKIKLVIKFGMNLLKIEDNLSNIPILSFHHGNPSKYRGRPAGFYEILNNEKTVGIIVQRLTNKLDAGKILAYAEAKIINFSYRKTSINFYKNSKFLLSKAIDNLSEKKIVNIKKSNKAFKLPSNFTVLKFLFLIFFNLNKKIFYGLFFEKKWKVAFLKNKLLLNGNKIINSNYLKEIPINKKYNFYADPFFSCNSKSIRLEALNKFSGLGELIEVSIKNFKEQKLSTYKRHHSYPFSFVHKKKEYLLPEVASYSAQYILSLDKGKKEKVFLKGLKNKRIIDATIIEHKKYWYLFFGEEQNASSILNLWISKSPFSKFRPHPKTPIVISPKNARMGGSILCSKNKLFRFGQNNEGEYGESLSILEINKLTPEDYSENYLGSLTVDKYKGPHTINFNMKKKLVILDYYENKFSFFAGIRRISGWLNK